MSPVPFVYQPSNVNPLLFGLVGLITFLSFSTFTFFILILSSNRPSIASNVMWIAVTFTFIDAVNDAPFAVIVVSPGEIAFMVAFVLSLSFASIVAKDGLLDSHETAVPAGMILAVISVVRPSSNSIS